MTSLPRKIILICLMIFLLSITSFASNKGMIDSREVIRPKFTYINVFHHNFDISSDGKSSVSVYLDAHSVDQVKVVANLQQANKPAPKGKKIAIKDD